MMNSETNNEFNAHVSKLEISGEDITDRDQQQSQRKKNI